MLENKVNFAFIKEGRNKFVSTFVAKNEVIKLIQNKNIEELPQPLNDIRIVWSDNGYTNFRLVINGDEKIITGHAAFFQVKDEEYIDFSSDAIKRLHDSEDVEIMFY
ncbi:hypothetical protein [Paenibacillus sp. FSL P4-0288]|uniref:hypothetical protein n=1 Tax=Paenibacillus sp. FSL P4-0288 TaxID=2921633 RepID=UPI0030FCC482